MKVTVPHIKQKKKTSEKIIALTAYDASMAKCLDQAGVVDIILVGDSLGMVIQGRQNTLSVTIEQMIYHTQAVARTASHAHIVADMPFLSYQVSHEKGIENAGRLLKEGGAESVKLEGGEEIASLVKKLTRIGIPVMGHLGLTPQSIHQFGGYKIQGRGEAGEQMIKDAIALEEAGAYSLVLESIPAPLAEEVTQRLSIPTIGIGAGVHCDGQILVIYDLLGFDPSFKPRFVKQYANLHAIVTESVQQFAAEVQQGKFPDSSHCWKS